jgi:two-component system sensor histidine kinase KdpD
LIGLTETLALDLTAEESPHQESLADDPRAGGADGAAGRQPAGHGQVANRRHPLAQGLAIVGGTGRLGARLLEQPLREHPLRLALDPELPLLQCDAVLIERALVNLLENATKYTPPAPRSG